MSININAGFNVGAPVALDSRQVLTKEEMANMNDNVMPDVYQATCKDDGLIYVYNKANEANLDTGKFRVLQSEDLLKEDIPFNCEVGGIMPGDTFNAGTSVNDIIKAISTKYYDPEVLLSIDKEKVVKKGTTIDTVEMTAIVTKNTNDIVSVTFTGVGSDVSEVVDGVTDGGTFTYDTVEPIASDTTLMVEVDDGKKTVTDTVSITFVDPIYYGVSATPDVTDVTALTELVELAGNKTVVYTADNEYLIYMTTGTVTSIKDVNGFENIDSFNVYEEMVEDTEYNLYISKTPITTTGYKYTFYVG